MSGENEVARNLLVQGPGRVESHANAANTPIIAQANGHAKRAGLYYVTPESGEPFTIEAKGREAWALDRLQILYLRRLHGLTEAQAQAFAALIWGLGQ
jgi:hypothetical protein